MQTPHTSTLNHSRATRSKGRTKITRSTRLSPNPPEVQGYGRFTKSIKLHQIQKYQGYTTFTRSIKVTPSPPQVQGCTISTTSSRLCQNHRAWSVLTGDWRACYHSHTCTVLVPLRHAFPFSLRRLAWFCNFASWQSICHPIIPLPHQNLCLSHCHLSCCSLSVHCC